MKPFSILALLRSPLAALLTPGTLMTTPRALLLTALLLASLAVLRAADAPTPALKVTQQLLNSIHVTPKLIFDPFPAYAQKFLPFAMAASMEVTHKGRLWTCWAGGQDGPNAYLLASYSDDQGKSWRDPVFVIDPQTHGLKMGTRLGSFWCDPKGRLWLFFHQSVGMFDGSCSNWYVRCDDPDAEKPVWTEPVYIGFGASLNKPIVRKNGEWILPVSLWERWHIDKPFADCYRELDAVRGANVLSPMTKAATGAIAAVSSSRIVASTSTRWWNCMIVGSGCSRGA